MLDRMSLSIKNQWFDYKNRAYIYFSIEDIMELLNCGRNKAIKSMRELDDETGIGLIEKRRQGFGKVNVIYVKTFMPEKTDEKKYDCLLYTSLEIQDILCYIVISFYFPEIPDFRSINSIFDFFFNICFC